MKILQSIKNDVVVNFIIRIAHSARNIELAQPVVTILFEWTL